MLRYFNLTALFVHTSPPLLAGARAATRRRRRLVAMKLSCSWALPLLWLPNALCVDHSKFRTCQQTNFCVRKRTAEPGRAYLVGPQSVSLTSNVLSAELHGGPWGVPLTLQLFAYDTGVARMRITETRPLHGPRWEPDDILLDQVSAMRLPCTCDALAMRLRGLQ